MDAYQLWTVASLVTSDLRSRINTVKNSFYESSSSVRIVWNTEGNSAERGREREGGKMEEVRRGRRDFVGFSARAKLNPRATTERSIAEIAEERQKNLTEQRHRHRT